ncbi:MAG: hypothetical protein ACIAQZ_14345 [Sedimentisphaeraceae bacterium JB056]
MICTIYKWMISASLTEGKQPSKHLKRHMAKCTACQRYYDSQVSLIKTLKSQAKDNLNISFAQSERNASHAPAAFKHLRVAAMIAIASLIAVVALIQLDKHSKNQINCLDHNAAVVIDTPVIQCATIAGTTGTEILNNQYSGLKDIAKETFQLVYESFKTATDAPGVTPEEN